MDLRVELPVAGWELRRVRMLLRFTARDVAEWLERRDMKPATVRGVYAMEERVNLRSAVIQQIAELFGRSEFERAMRLVREQEAKRREANRLRVEERRRKHEEAERERLERKRMAGAKELEALEARRAV